MKKHNNLSDADAKKDIRVDLVGPIVESLIKEAQRNLKDLTKNSKTNMENSIKYLNDAVEDYKENGSSEDTLLEAFDNLYMLTWLVATEKLEQEVGILDILLDEDNEDPITVYDENDKAINFDQVAIIPMDEKLYAILKPIDEMEGVADDEAIVFYINETGDGDATLEIETDESVAMRVFDEYYNLLDKAEK